MEARGAHPLGPNVPDRKTAPKTARFTQYMRSPGPMAICMAIYAWPYACPKEAQKQRGLHRAFRAPCPKEAKNQRGLRNAFRAPFPEEAQKQRGLHSTFRAPCGMPRPKIWQNSAVTHITKMHTGLVESKMGDQVTNHTDPPVPADSFLCWSGFPPARSKPS